MDTPQTHKATTRSSDSGSASSDGSTEFLPPAEELLAKVIKLEAANLEMQAQTAAVAGANANAVELMIEVEEARDELAETTNALRHILDNVEHGFLHVGLDLKVGSEVSARCHTLFGTRSIAGQPLSKVLRLTPQQADELELAVEQLAEDLLPEELSLHQIGSRITLEGRRLELSWRLLRNEESHPEGVIISVTDITEIEHERAENSTNQTLLLLLRRREAFVHFLQESQMLLRDIQESLGRMDSVRARRGLHTVKGNAACWGLTRVANQVHEIEGLARLTPQDTSPIDAQFRAFLTEHQDVLKLSWEDLGNAEGQMSTVSSVALASLANAVQAQDWKATRHQLRQLQQRPVEQLLGPIQQRLTETALQFEKKIDFELLGGDLLVEPHHIGPVLTNLVHLICNSVVHGIEAPSRRGEKPEVGRIWLKIELYEGGIQIMTGDDGAGIQCEQVLDKAIESGIFTEAEGATLSQAEVIALIFRDGLSTSASVDSVRGRGVGMAAVAEAIAAVGGQLSVATEPGKGTQFCMFIPDEETRAEEAPPASNGWLKIQLNP